MPVTLRRRGPGRLARHRIGARGHDHGRSGMAGGNLGVDIVAVVGAIAGDGRHCPIDPLEQGPDLGAVIGILVGQHRGDDVAGIGVRREMQHSPGPAPLGAVLLLQPLARAAELQPCAVHQQVHRLAPRLWSRHLQRLGSAAEGAVIRHREIEIEQLENGADQPLGLAQRQAEHASQRQRRGDRQIGGGGLPAPGGARRCHPGRDRLRREPYGQAAAGTQTGIVLGPVGHPVPLLGDVMATGCLGFERHGGGPRFHEEWIVTCAVAEMGRSTFLWGPIMLMPAAQPETPAAIRVDLGAIFVSLELSTSTWLVTSLAPGSEKMSRHIVTGGDTAGLFACFADLRKKAQARSGKLYPLVVIQEAGLDGFWIDRVLNREDWIESHVVDAASIAVPRRHRRVKTDRIDGETLIRTLMAYKRGEPRVCSMVRVPTPEEEDRRRLCRERKALVAERVLHVNRIRGLLFSQGIRDYKPLHRDRRKRLEELRTGDDRALSVHIKAQICRELDHLELLLEQIKAVDAERDVLVVEKTAATLAPAAMLLDIKGIGPEFAAVLHSEGLFRHFANRRQLAAYAGLAPSPWKSGSIDREQGVSKAGNPRLRTTMIQLAWLWLRHQPNSRLTRWFHDRVMQNGGRFRKVAVVALARKLPRKWSAERVWS